MDPDGTETKNYCAVEGQQQINRRSVELRGLKSPSVVRQKNVIMGLAGLGTKNGCADEDKQQFTRQKPVAGQSRWLTVFSFIVSCRYLATTNKQTDLCVL
jgi:hypothetical protein